MIPIIKLTMYICAYASNKIKILYSTYKYKKKSKYTNTFKAYYQIWRCNYYTVTFLYKQMISRLKYISVSPYNESKLLVTVF